MRRSQVVWGLSVAVAATCAATTPTGARTYEHARAVGARCSTCHDTHRPGIENLNARGRWFMRHRTLDGFSPEKAAAEERRDTQARPPADKPAERPQEAAQKPAAAEPSRRAQASATSTALETGTKVFERACQVCHGTRGTGTRMARPLDQSGFYADTVEQIAEIVRDGISGTTMQPFKGRLTEDEILAVAQYVDSLRKPAGGVKR